MICFLVQCLIKIAFEISETTKIKDVGNYICMIK